MPKLPKTYRLLTLIIFFIGVLVIGVVFYYRDYLFKKFNEVVNPVSYNHAYLKPVSFKVESQWLKNINYIRDEKVLLPEGYEAVVFASNLNSPSKIEVVDNYVLITEQNTGTVTVLEDSDFDNSANYKNVFDSGLQNPNGLSVYNNDLYLAADDRVIVYKNIKDQIEKNDSQRTNLVTLPEGGVNNLKNIFVNSGGIFVSVGSSCDVCVETNKKRASILKYSLDGTSEEIYASGLRSVGGMTEVGPSLIVTEDSVKGSKDEIDVIKKNGFYGWPYFVEKNVDTNFDSGEDKNLNPIPSEFEFEADSVPAGINYIENSSNNGALFVVLSNLSQIQKIAFFESQPSFDDFFILRPVKNNPVSKLYDIKHFRNGFLVTDKSRGIVYFVYPK